MRRARESGFAGRSVRRPLNRGSSRRRVLHTCAGADSRQQVSEPIGLGKSSRCERSRSRGAGVGLKPNACPWPVKSRLAELRKERWPPVRQAVWGGESRRDQQARSCAWGRPWARWAGFDRSGGCAQRSFWLQKSTCGARSSRPRADMPAQSRRI